MCSLGHYCSGGHFFWFIHTLDLFNICHLSVVGQLADIQDSISERRYNTFRPKRIGCGPIRPADRNEKKVLRLIFSSRQRSLTVKSSGSAELFVVIAAPFRFCLLLFGCLVACDTTLSPEWQIQECGLHHRVKLWSGLVLFSQDVVFDRRGTAASNPLLLALVKYPYRPR